MLCGYSGKFWQRQFKIQLSRDNLGEEKVPESEFLQTFREPKTQSFGNDGTTSRIYWVDYKSLVLIHLENGTHVYICIIYIYIYIYIYAYIINKVICIIGMHTWFLSFLLIWSWNSELELYIWEYGPKVCFNFDQKNSKIKDSTSSFQI